MPVFEYRVRQPDGRVVAGTLSADSARGARDRLRRDGGMLEAVHEVVDQVVNQAVDPRESSSDQSSRGWGSWSRAWTQRRLAGQTSWFVRELATLTRVGTPIVDALELAIEQSHGAFRRVVLELREQVVAGRSLAAAMRRHPEAFDQVLTEMVAVGEQSGALPDVLSQAAKYRERADRLRDRVLSALLYPALVTLLSVGVTLFLMSNVAPTLLASLEEMGRELPWPTRVLKAASDGLARFGPVAAVVAAVAVASFAIWRRTTAGRRIWDGWLLRTPLLGSLLLRQDASRLAMVTGTLLKSGVELVRAMEIAHGAIRNVRVAEVFAEARRNIAAGGDLAASLRAEKTLPPALIQVFDLGQHTGELEALLFEIAEDYDHQVQTSVERLTTLLEPVLIVGLSVVVGFILVATLLPILETGNALADG